MFKPTKYTIVSGIGRSKYPLVAFDAALQDAGIGDYNLVKVSSIMPANCEYRDKIEIENGSIIFTAFATMTITEGETGSTGVAVAIPINPEHSGVIFENSAQDFSAEKNVIAMAKQAMENRNKEYAEIKSSSKTATGEKGIFTSIISAVSMW